MLRDTFTNFARLRGVRLEDLFSIRAVLEGDAVRRASEQPSSPYIEEAAQALEEMRALPVGPEFDDADMRFHCCLVRASGSEAAHVLVLAINDAMVSQMAPAVLQGGSGGFRAVKLRQHRSLIDAIRAGDGDKAASIISRHLKAGFAALPAETLNEPKGDAR